MYDPEGCQGKVGMLTTSQGVPDRSYSLKIEKGRLGKYWGHVDHIAFFRQKNAGRSREVVIKVLRAGYVAHCG